MSASFEIAKPFLGHMVKVTVDRPLGSKHPDWDMVYEVNYGYVEGVKAPDGEDLDAYYLGVEEPCTEATGRCIAIVHRLNDDDDKLVVVPDGVELSDGEIARAVSFQERWYQSVILRS